MWHTERGKHVCLNLVIGCLLFTWLHLNKNGNWTVSVWYSEFWWECIQTQMYMEITDCSFRVLPLVQFVVLSQDLCEKQHEAPAGIRREYFPWNTHMWLKMVCAGQIICCWDGGEGGGGFFQSSGSPSASCVELFPCVSLSALQSCRSKVLR